MHETDIRAYLIEKLQVWGDLRPIENDAGVGFPDINFYFPAFDFEGWIEVKYIRKEPARLSTPIFGEILRPSQRIWFRQKCASGYTRSFIFIRSIDSFYLFKGSQYREVEKYNSIEAKQECLWYWVTINNANKETWESLYNCLVLWGSPKFL